VSLYHTVSIHWSNMTFSNPDHRLTAAMSVPADAVGTAAAGLVGGWVGGVKAKQSKINSSSSSSSKLVRCCKVFWSC